MLGIFVVFCCARAASDQVVAAPPSRRDELASLHSITISAASRPLPQGRETNAQPSSWRPARILLDGTMDRAAIQLLTILPRIVFMSPCVNARRVCVRI